MELAWHFSDLHPSLMKENILVSPSITWASFIFVSFLTTLHANCCCVTLWIANRTSPEAPCPRTWIVKDWWVRERERVAVTQYYRTASICKPDETTGNIESTGVYVFFLIHINSFICLSRSGIDSIVIHLFYLPSRNHMSLAPLRL